MTAHRAPAQNGGQSIDRTRGRKGHALRVADGESLGCYLGRDQQDHRQQKRHDQRECEVDLPGHAPGDEQGVGEERGRGRGDDERQGVGEKDGGQEAVRSARSRCRIAAALLPCSARNRTRRRPIDVSAVSVALASADTTKTDKQQDYLEPFRCAHQLPAI